jgi:hypothetical protein
MNIVAKSVKKKVIVNVRNHNKVAVTLVVTLAVKTMFIIYVVVIHTTITRAVRLVTPNVIHRVIL